MSGPRVENYGGRQNVQNLATTDWTSGVSRVLTIEQMVPCALLTGSGFDGTAVTFQTSFDGTTYQTIKDDSGTDYSVTTTASDIIALDLAIMHACGPFLKIVSNNASENGTASLMLRPLS